MSLLSVDIKEFAYHERCVFHDISFSLEENGVIGVYGPSGIGKTTLLKIV